MLSVRYSCHILLTLEFWAQIFEKFSDIKFYENPSSGRPRCSIRTDGRIDRHVEANTVIPRLTSDPDNEFFG